MKVRVVCRKLYDYVRYDLKEIAFPSSLPDPPHIKKRRKLTWNERFLVLKEASRLYAASWVRDIGPELRPNDFKDEESEDKPGRPQGPAKEKEPSTLEDLAVAARGGMETLKPALQRVYMTRASAYKDALQSFIHGYQEGIQQVMALVFAQKNSEASVLHNSIGTMWKQPLDVVKANVSSNPRTWIVIGLSVAGIVIVAETQRRRRRSRAQIMLREPFLEPRFDLLPFPQPPPPAARQPLASLTFAISDIFDVKGYVTGFGSPDWAGTHEAATKTALVVTALLKNGATCVGKTVMDELNFGITGENVHYGTPVNPQLQSHIPGGSSSGSAVAVAAGLVDFALGIDTTGCVRIPASFCGVIGFRPSHGAVSMIGVSPNSQSLDTVGIFTRDPSILHHVGHVLLQLKSVETKRPRRLIFADDLFQLSKVPTEKTVQVVTKAIEHLSGYQPPKHMNFSQYVASNVPGLKGFREESVKHQNEIFTLKALSSVMLLLQRCEFKTNHEEWVKSAKPRLGPDASDHVRAAIDSTHENMKTLYKVRTEMRAALQSLLKDDGILVIPTVADPPLKLNTKKRQSSEFNDRTLALSSIASMSGCCQVTIPVGKHKESPISISFIAFHSVDKFLLDTVLDMYSSIQEKVSIASHSSPLPDTNDNLDVSELLKEKGNAAFKGKQWNKAVKYYTEAIKLNMTSATYYCNRAAAYLELGCFQQAEEDCSKAISLDKKNVKAYMRRGTARESLLCYKDAAQDFKHALVLEPQNKVANLAEKRLRELMS